MSRHPTIKWAQRSEKIFLTVDLPDANDINVEESKVNNGVRNIVYVIKKAESKWWSRLLKQEGKPLVFLKVDWDKWVDEDDEEEKTDMDFNDMDFPKGLKKKKKKKKTKGKGLESRRTKMSLLQQFLTMLNLKCILKKNEAGGNHVSWSF
ncbi:hypothetical protein MKX01_034744 [Papaver californicum]|nr:hypothetical protein MKX01_034744 [Papaver californicum]